MSKQQPPSPPDALVAPAMSPEAKAAIIEAWHSAEAPDGPQIVQPETAEQRRERLTEAAARDIALCGPHPDDSFTPAEAAVDAIIASDRATGYDPEALRGLLEVTERLRAKYKKEAGKYKAERDAARAEVERLNLRIADMQHAGFNAAADIACTEAECESLAASVERLKAESDGLAARLAVVTGALKRIAFARPDRPARAAALMQVVEAALASTSPAINERDGMLRRKTLMLACDDFRALDGEARHG